VGADLPEGGISVIPSPEFNGTDPETPISLHPVYEILSQSPVRALKIARRGSDFVHDNPLYLLLEGFQRHCGSVGAMLQADGSFHTIIPGSSRRIDARRAGPGPVGRATARDVDSGTNDVLPGPRSGS
jgi:hypothetical protein